MLYRWPIFVSRSRVQDLMIVQQLNISRFKHHVEPQAVTRNQLVEQIHSLNLFGEQPRYLVKTLRRFDKIPGINTRDITRMSMKHSQLIRRLFTQRYLVFPIYIEGLTQNLEEVGSLLGQHVKGACRRSDSTCPTPARRF